MSKFGWCLDGLHKRCRPAIIRERDKETLIYRCECTCHTEKESK